MNINVLDNLLKKKWFVPAILVSTFFSGILISFSGFTLYNALVQKPNKIAVPTPKINSFAQSTPESVNNNNPEKGVYNALLLGFGGGNHDGADLTDSMIIVHVNTNTHKAALISVPRDLWVPGNQKINAIANTGFQNSGPVVTDVTGLPMNYYIAIDFSGFTKLIDNLGGITVITPQTFDDPFYPIDGQENNTCGFTNDQINAFKAQYSGFQLESQFTCRYEHLHFDKGSTNLDGTTALKFVRSRHGDSDFGRSLRQFAVLQGIANKLISFQALNKLNDTVNTLFQMVRTDLDLGTIKSLAEVFLPAQGGIPGLYKLSQIQLSTDNVLNQGVSSDGQFILTPKSGGFNFQGIKDYIKSQL